MRSFLRRVAYLVPGRTLFWLSLCLFLIVLAPPLLDLPRDRPAAPQRQPVESYNHVHVLRLLWLAGSFLWVSTKLLVQYRLRGRVQPASEALKEMEQTRGEYALLLRPFGADGFIHVETGLTMPGEKEKKRRWRETTTVEMIITESVAASLAVPTFTVVSPEQVVLAPGPRYVRASDDWKQDVDGLLRRALFVVVIFPPGKGCTPAVRWELERCVRLGLTGRLLLVTPPSEMDGSGASCRALSEVRDLFPGLARAPTGTLGAFPLMTGSVRYWRMKRDPTGKSGAGGHTYSGILQQALMSVRATCAPLSFASRYPYLQPETTIRSVPTAAGRSHQPVSRSFRRTFRRARG